MEEQTVITQSKISNSYEKFVELKSIIIKEPFQLDPTYLYTELKEIKLDEYSIDDLVGLSLEMIKLVSKEKGMGLAANQVGYDLRMFVWHYINKWELVLNPRLIGLPGGKQAMKEKCLSVDHEVSTQRFKKIRVMYTTIKDGKYKPIVRELSKIPAVIFQHEFDHLNGYTIERFEKDVLKMINV